MAKGIQRKSQDRSPQFESLEAMTLLSGVAPVMVPLTTSAHIQAEAATAVALAGNTTGTYTSNGRIADAGKSYVLHSRGRLGSLGAVNVAGTLHSTGFIATGHAGGTLTLATTRGTLTLQLTGPTQKGFAALPSQFSYQITGGTGKYRTASGSGTVSLTLTPAASSTAILGHGRVALAFS